MIGIVGATGNVGKEVAKFLQQEGTNFIAFTTDVERYNSKNSYGTPRKLILGEEETYQSLAGISRLFLVRPPELSDIDLFDQFLTIAKKLDIRYIVFLSLLGVEDNKFAPHGKIEKLIIEKGFAFTFLRASFFMENLSTTHLMEIQEQHEIYIPCGDAKTSFIAVKDIGAAGAICLIAPSEHRNVCYDLTGAEALSYYEIGDSMSEILGVEIKYRNPSMLPFFFHMKKRKFATMHILVMCMLYHITKKGNANKVTQDLSQLLERPPTTIQAFITENAELFSPIKK